MWPRGPAWVIKIMMVIKIITVGIQHYNPEKIEGKCNYVIWLGFIICKGSYIKNFMTPTFFQNWNLYGEAKQELQSSILVHNFQLCQPLSSTQLPSLKL
jgi:hypothetical protein